MRLCRWKTARRIVTTTTGGNWTAKGPRVLSTHELPAATASNRAVASKKAPLVKPNDEWGPGSASDPFVSRHHQSAKRGVRRSLSARLCQLQAKVDKISQAEGRTLFVGQSKSKERLGRHQLGRRQKLGQSARPDQSTERSLVGPFRVSNSGLVARAVVEGDAS